MAFEVTLHRMIIFFLILAVGFAAGKKGIIKKDYLPNLAMLITKILLPCVIFYGTVTSVTKEKLIENYFIIIFAIVFYIVVAGILFLLAKLMRLKGDRDKVFTFSFLFGNTGFVGIPLLVALFPEHGMMFMCLFSVVDQIVFWTFGIFLATERGRSVSFNAKSFLTPNTIAIAIALVFVLVEIPIPSVIGDTLSTLNGATSAMCMMYLGALVCFSKWTPALKCKELYVGILVKMILLPVCAGHLFMQMGFSQEAMVSMVIIMSLPIMTVVPMIVSMHGKEGEYATGLTVITLVVSVVTIPFVQLLAFM